MFSATFRAALIGLDWTYDALSAHQLGSQGSAAVDLPEQGTSQLVDALLDIAQREAEQTFARPHTQES